jgi:outer membrane protein TolC
MKKYLLSIILLTCTTVVFPQEMTLEQLKDSAFKNNNSLRAARYDIEASQLQRREAFTKFFPNVSGTAAWFNSNKHLISTDVNTSEYLSPAMVATLAETLPLEALAALNSPISINMLKNGKLAGVNAIQPLFAGGQIINGNKLAKVGQEVSELKLQLTQDEVELQTEQYYWQLVSLKEKLHTIEAANQLLADIHKDADVAVRAGVAMRNDLLQVQLRQNDLASQKLKLQNGISLLHMLLAQYCGLHHSSFTIHYPQLFAGDSIITKTDYEPRPTNFQLTALPEYQLLQKQVEATQLQHRMEVGSRLPSIGVGVGYNYNDLTERDLSFAMVFATVSVPISDWWGGSYAIKRKKIEHQKAVDQLNDNIELLTIRMQKSWNDLQEAYSQIELARQGMRQSEENLRLNRNFFRAGTGTMSELLEAQLLSQQTRDKYVEAVADYHIKLIIYRQANGE